MTNTFIAFDFTNAIGSLLQHQIFFEWIAFQLLIFSDRLMMQFVIKKNKEMKFYRLRLVLNIETMILFIYFCR